MYNSAIKQMAIIETKVPPHQSSPKATNQGTNNEKQNQMKILIKVMQELSGKRQNDKMITAN
jgi:hypothetical protein